MKITTPINSYYEIHETVDVSICFPSWSHLSLNEEMIGRLVRDPNLLSSKRFRDRSEYYRLFYHAKWITFGNRSEDWFVSLSVGGGWDPGVRFNLGHHKRLQRGHWEIDEPSPHKQETCITTKTGLGILRGQNGRLKVTKSSWNYLKGLKKRMDY